MERSVHFQQTGISTRFTPQLEDLADQVSCLLHAIRELTITTNANDATADTVRELFDAFKQALNTEVIAPQFADLFAQTLSYGLFAANQHSRHKDPLSYFHEKFLEQNNPQLRGLRGVYYTPDPVVSYIVRSIDFLLRSCFDRRNGLAEISEDMLLLDPACGTGIFLQAVIEHIRNEFQETSEPERWRDYVHLYLLPRLFGFELLSFPYVIAHLKLAMQLAALDLS